MIGCSAGFVNVPRIKGTHNAMKTGMLAVEATFKQLLENKDSPSPLLEDKIYLEKSSYEKILKVRNVKPSLKWGLILGNMHSGINMWLNDLGLGFLLPTDKNILSLIICH